MKTITCEQMGGPCSMQHVAGNERDMVAAQWKHMEEFHPERVAEIEKMSQEEKDARAAKFHRQWQTTPEDMSSI